jgi:hypothetical protein
MGYLVFTQIENSLPAKLLPQLGEATTTLLPHFRSVDCEVSRPDSTLCLYRFVAGDP